MMTRNLIKSFSVYGLFGKDNVHIPFDENIKILIGKNGIGKTQILNIFYNILTCNFKNLNKFIFDKVELYLHDSCDFLLAVTHSPFIFDNELDKYAIGLNEYIQPQDKVTA